MEFLRFGSSIPGAYWGCCAVCIVQDFKQAPSDKACIQLVDGDGGNPLMVDGKERAFMGPTYEDIFRERIRTGTFSTSNMPNHAFFAILTDWQVSSSPGKEWLKILKEEGFEFLRTTDNSVYTGDTVPDVMSTAETDVSTNGKCDDCDCTEEFCGSSGNSSHENYIFALFRNISTARVANPLTPPKAWQDLSNGRTEAWELMAESQRLDVASLQSEWDLKHWHDHGPTKIMKESEAEASGSPLWMAGLRSKHPQQLKTQRDAASKTTGQNKPGTFPLASTGQGFQATILSSDEIVAA